VIIGNDHHHRVPANLEDGLKEMRRGANPSRSSVLADPSVLRALNTEAQDHWVQYRDHHIQEGIPRPPSMLSGEETVGDGDDDDGDEDAATGNVNAK
jgi:hypothetical protein